MTLEALLRESYFTYITIFITIASLALVYVTLKHYQFFHAGQSNDTLGHRIRDVFLADLFNALSVLSFNATGWLSGTFDAYRELFWVRVALKLFQLASTIYTLYASVRLHKYYKKIK